MGMGSSLLTQKNPERDAQRQNKQIESTLKRDRLDQMNIIKLLLLGNVELFYHSQPLMSE